MVNNKWNTRKVLPEKTGLYLAILYDTHTHTYLPQIARFDAQSRTWSCALHFDFWKEIENPEAGVVPGR